MPDVPSLVITDRLHPQVFPSNLHQPANPSRIVSLDSPGTCTQKPWPQWQAEHIPPIWKCGKSQTPLLHSHSPGLASHSSAGSSVSELHQTWTGTAPSRVSVAVVQPQRAALPCDGDGARLSPRWPALGLYQTSPCPLWALPCCLCGQLSLSHYTQNHQAQSAWKLKEWEGSWIYLAHAEALILCDFHHLRKKNKNTELCTLSNVEQHFSYAGTGTWVSASQEKRQIYD